MCPYDGVPRWRWDQKSSIPKQESTLPLAGSPPHNTSKLFKKGSAGFVLMTGFPMEEGLNILHPNAGQHIPVAGYSHAKKGSQTNSSTYFWGNLLISFKTQANVCESGCVFQTGFKVEEGVWKRILS